MTTLLPCLHQLWHPQHSLSAFLEFRLERPLPDVTLHLLTHARSLDPQPLLFSPPSFLGGALDGKGKQFFDAVLAGELDEIGLTP